MFDWLDDNMGCTIAMIGLALFMGCVVFPCCVADVGGADGQHTGVVTAVERAKNITWDSTIVYIKSDTSSTQEDRYCVESDTLAQKLRDFAETGERVTVKFRNDLIMLRWDCNGGASIVYDVQLAKPKAVQP